MQQSFHAPLDGLVPMPRICILNLSREQLCMDLYSGFCTWNMFYFIYYFFLFYLMVFFFNCIYSSVCNVEVFFLESGLLKQIT